MRTRGWLLLGFALSACSDRPGTVPSGDALAELSEECRIDGYSESLVSIGRILIGANDQVIVEQSQQSQLRFYDAQCELLGTFGREGQGPGEFSSLGGIGFVADTLWAWDRALSRVTLVSQDRQLMRSFALPQPIRSTSAEFAGLTGYSAFVRGVLTNGHVIVEFAPFAVMDLPEPYTNQVILGVVTPASQLEGIVAQVPHGGPLAYFAGNAGGTIPYPLRNPAIVVVSDNSTRIAAATTTLEGDQADTFSVTMSDARGTTIWNRSLPFEPVVLTTAVVDSVISQRMQGRPAQFQTAFREQVRIPPVYPPVTGLLVGQDGSLWIELIVRDRIRPYLVLSAEGDVVGTTNLSEHGRVAAARLDRIWVTERDHLDVESIVTYQVSW